jgi:hypothetical protein
VPPWDYKTIVLTGGFMGRHKEELNRAEFEKKLDELGRDGGSCAGCFSSRRCRRRRTATSSS